MKALIIAWNIILLCLRSWVLYLILGLGVIVAFALGGVVMAIPRDLMIKAEDYADSRQKGLAIKVQEELDDEEYRVVMAATARDVCFIYLLAPGGVLAAALLASLFNEAHRTTTHTLAARPVRRSSILLGGFLSSACVTVLIVAVLAAATWLLGLALLGESDWRVFAGAATLCLAFLAVAAWGTCFSTLVNPIAAVPIALIHAALGWRSVMVREFLERMTHEGQQFPEAMQSLVKFAYWVMPHYQDTHELAKTLLYGEPADPITLHSLYLSLLHIVVALTIAALVFRRRDV